MSIITGNESFSRPPSLCGNASTMLLRRILPSCVCHAVEDVCVVARGLGLHQLDASIASRSADLNWSAELRVPRTHCVKQSAFCHAHSSLSLDAFRRQLKTYLFGR